MSNRSALQPSPHPTNQLSLDEYIQQYNNQHIHNATQYNHNINNTIKQQLYSTDEQTRLDAQQYMRWCGHPPSTPSTLNPSHTDRLQWLQQNYIQLQQQVEYNNKQHKLYINKLQQHEANINQQIQSYQLQHNLDINQLQHRYNELQQWINNNNTTNNNQTIVGSVLNGNIQTLFRGIATAVTAALTEHMIPGNSTAPPSNNNVIQSTINTSSHADSDDESPTSNTQLNTTSTAELLIHSLDSNSIEPSLNTCTVVPEWMTEQTNELDEISRKLLATKQSSALRSKRTHTTSNKHNISNEYEFGGKYNHINEHNNNDTHTTIHTSSSHNTISNTLANNTPFIGDVVSSRFDPFDDTTTIQQQQLIPIDTTTTTSSTNTILTDSNHTDVHINKNRCKQADNSIVHTGAFEFNPGKSSTHKQTKSARKKRKPKQKRKYYIIETEPDSDIEIESILSSRSRVRNPPDRFKPQLSRKHGKHIKSTHKSIDHMSLSGLIPLNDGTNIQDIPQHHDKTAYPDTISTTIIE